MKLGIELFMYLEGSFNQAWKYYPPGQLLI